LLIKAVKKAKSTSGQHLVKKLRESANNLRCKLTIMWISGHSEVMGNEKADELAKQATEHRSSRLATLPPDIRRGIPISISAAKEELHQQLLRDWEEQWNNSPRRERFIKLEDSVPLQRYRKLQDRLTRDQASKIMQIRSRHVPLNTYLYRIGKARSRRCPKCKHTTGEAAPPLTRNGSPLHLRLPRVCRRRMRTGKSTGKVRAQPQKLDVIRKGTQSANKIHSENG